MSRLSFRSCRSLSVIPILLAAVLPFSVEAQTQPPRRKSTPPKPAVSKLPPGCLSKKAALGQIQRFIEQAKTFNDVEAKVRTGADLGSLLWPCEPLHAEAVFLELHETLKGEIKKRQESPGAPASGGAGAAVRDKDAIPVGRLKFLHSYLLSRIHLHNPALFERLSKSEAVSLGDVSYSTVKTLLGEGDAERAAAELKKSVASGHGDVELLLALRGRDAEAADSLYLAHLSNLARRAHASSRELAEAGAYVFTSNPNDDNGSVWLVLASVDGTVVPHFVARRPAAPEGAMRAYLRLTASLLGQPVENPAEKKARYALGRVLIPYVPQADAELRAAFANGMQRLAGEVTDGVKNDRTYEFLAGSAKQNWDNFDHQLEGIQKMPSAEQRDELCVMLAHALYASKLYEKALKVVGLMSPSDTRDELETVLKLAIAHQHLSRKQPSEAQQVAHGVAPGYGRAVFWLNLAQALRAGGDEQGATQSVMQAVVDARREQGPERPLLLLKAAGVVKASDPLLAEQLRQESFVDINALERWRAPRWETEAVARRATLRFSLAGAERLSFNEVLKPFVKDDPAAFESAVAELKSEQLRAEGLLMLAKHLLADGTQGARPKPATKESN